MSSLIEILAPEQFEGTRSQVQRWLKSLGDVVEKDEPLIEVETDKVVVEIPSPASGKLMQIIKKEQEDFEPGELLGAIASIDSMQIDVNPVAAPSSSVTSSGAAEPAASRSEMRVNMLSAHAATLISSRLSPAVRRLLSENNLDPALISPSGDGGRITAKDVLAHLNRSGDDVPATAARAGVTRIPHSTMRKRIAERMVQSLLHTAPHVTTMFEVDMGAVMAHRAVHREAFQQRGVSLTLTSYFLAACVDGILEVPEVNSRWCDDALELNEVISIGVGTALEGRGLVVPVVRNLHTLDLFGIARQLGDLVKRAREDKLKPADVGGGTFTISNHGVSGSVLAAPIIINQPQAAILGIGKLEKRAVVVEQAGEDCIVIRPRCFVTLTIDHRVMDGHQANRFMIALTRKLEGWSD